ncbi:Optineurin [Chionoecetes opilio]|uniref:Optineurin n=1 Tax=Chionoecetes opilio TaxID=41210 RepID=A0A8J4XSC1_CHIOP|nr:Optineurin [Chionoecetes opilio]
MVRQEEVRMGQGGLCGVTMPTTDSLPPMTQPALSGSASGTAVEMQESLSCLVAGEETVSQEELVARFRTIINENLLLKETIAQNNMGMRQQLGLIVKWRQQNEQLQQEQRQQITDLSQQVSSRQQENATLRAQLTACTQLPEDAQPRFQELDNTIIVLNTRLAAAERTLRQTQGDRDKLMAQRSRLEGDITLLKCDLTTSRSEQERLQLERFELLSTANELRQQLRQSRDGVSAVVRSAECSPITESACGLMSAADIQKLREQLRKEQDISTTLLQELHDTRNQVEALERDMQQAQEEAKNQRALSRKLQSQATTAPTPTDSQSKEPVDAREKKQLKDEAAMLREEVDTLEAALEAERRKNSEERTSLVRAHGEVGRLKREVQEVREQAERESQNDQYYQVQIKSISEKHDEATAKLLSYEELLAAKNDEISKMKRQVGQAKAALAERASESETIAILRAQVEVYQGDFRAEREGREAMATDREKLRDDLRHLQTRNTQLVDELEAYQRRNFNQGPGRGSRPTSEEPAGALAAAPTAPPQPLTAEALWERLSNASDKKEEDKEEELDENLFYCPKCNKTFTQYRPLEEHVNRCLDED